MRPLATAIGGWVVAGLLVALAAGVSPASAFSILSEAQEIEIGRKADPEIQKRYGVVDDPALQAYVASVGRRVTEVPGVRPYPYRFLVLDSPEVNAFAVPGGYVYVTRGMLAALASEAELAGVLGHEIGHVSNRDGARQLTKGIGLQVLTMGLAIISPGGRENAGAWAQVMSQLSTLILLGYSREAELEADAAAVSYLHGAGYDPQAAPRFLRRLRQRERLGGVTYPGILATHPDSATRIARADTLAALPRSGVHAIGDEEYKSRLDGLVYGERGDKQRVRLYVAKAGETIADVARTVLGEPGAAWEVALLNGVDQDTLLREGQLVKYVARDASVGELR
jgi:predicted Zn-dependent protease